jgi:hypothetical protein
MECALRPIGFRLGATLTAHAVPILLSNFPTQHLVTTTQHPWDRERPAFDYVMARPIAKKVAAPGKGYATFCGTSMAKLCRHMAIVSLIA